VGTSYLLSYFLLHTSNLRIWDLPTGYLSRQRLLGEHRELHGLQVILAEGRRGYSRHPETLRWVGALTGLAWRHAQLSAEMALRGYVDRTPLPLDRSGATWPDTFITEPAGQIALLREKYGGRESGRIPLPRNAQQLWAQHKYSVMARDPGAYRRLGRAVAAMRGAAAMADLARTLVLALRQAPVLGRLVNALEHMWGHVSEFAEPEGALAAKRSPAALLSLTQTLAIRHREAFLLSSTALSELATYVTSPSETLEVGSEK